MQIQPGAALQPCFCRAAMLPACALSLAVFAQNYTRCPVLQRMWGWKYSRITWREKKKKKIFRVVDVLMCWPKSNACRIQNPAPFSDDATKDFKVTHGSLSTQLYLVPIFLQSLFLKIAAGSPHTPVTAGIVTCLNHGRVQVFLPLWMRLSA